MIILAGGGGTQLSPNLQRSGVDALPKQYIESLDRRSMFEATLERAKKLAPPERHHVVIPESHFKFPEVAQQLQGFPYSRVSGSPLNRESGWDLLLPLAQLFRNHPGATVVALPFEPFIEEENLFLSHVEAAFRLVEWQEKKLVLLGLAPNAPETDYGYILARHARLNAIPFDAREVSCFVEKPNPFLARKLILQGGYWNTLVMIFKVKTLLDYLRALSPVSYRGFEQICAAVARPNFSNTTRRVFTQAADLNLSKELLEPLAVRQDHPLLVLPVRGVHGNDRGSKLRIMNSLAPSKDKCGVTA